MDRVDQSFYKQNLNKLPLVEVEERLAFYKRTLQKELLNKGIRFDVHLWVSDDWFCPDGVPGFAVPFYLFHPELLKIEKKEVGYVEGRSEKEILKIMRHELGHSIDNAFRLRKNKERALIFGSSRKEYPESYRPKKYSKSYVHYLGDNYAQSHPDEDFAETFAVWLDPQSHWREKYLGTPALDKLLFMDQLMRSTRRKRPLLKNRFKVDGIQSLKMTLSEYYNEKSKRLGLGKIKRLDREIAHFFSRSSKTSKMFPVSSYLKKERKSLCKRVALQTNSYQYDIDFVINKTIDRAQSLGVYGTKEQLLAKAPLLIEKNYRYLKEKQQLQYFL